MNDYSDLQDLVMQKEVLQYILRSTKNRYFKSGELSKVNIGLSYHLSLGERDEGIIKDIDTKLNNIGSIYKYSNRPDVRLAINNKQGLLDLIKICDLYSLSTKHQLRRFLIVKMAMDNSITEFKTRKDYDAYVKYLFKLADNKISDKYNLESYINMP